MSRIFLGIKNNKDNCFLQIFDTNANDIVNINMSDISSISYGNKKYCVGVKNVVENTFLPCAENAFAYSDSQCYKCMLKDEFNKCIKCHGNYCNVGSSDVLDYCNQKHVVYLAYFHGEKIKVGTAHITKKIQRLIEQGCLYALIIAEAPSGRIARYIEQAISDMGYLQAVSIKYKMEHMRRDDSIDSILKKLINHYEKIKENISADMIQYFFKKAEIYCDQELSNKIIFIFNNYSSAQLSLWDDCVYDHYEVFDKGEIYGDILAVVGTIAIILEKNSNIIYLHNFKKKIGYNIYIQLKKEKTR